MFLTSFKSFFWPVRLFKGISTDRLVKRHPMLPKKRSDRSASRSKDHHCVGWHKATGEHSRKKITRVSKRQSDWDSLKRKGHTCPV